MKRAAADITGGRFQVIPKTGELFEPIPEELARTVCKMLDGLDKYDPRNHCITIDDAADQLEQVARKLQITGDRATP